MALVQHSGGVFGKIGDRVFAAYRPDEGLTVPEIEPVGSVETVSGRWQQMFSVGEPTAGYTVYGGLTKRKKVAVQPGFPVVDLGPATGDRSAAQFYIYRASPLNGSNPIDVPLTFPGGEGEAPVFAAAIAPRIAIIGSSLTIATAQAFSGAVTAYALAVEGGGALPAGFSINAATGLITGSTAVALTASLIVTASNAYGSAVTPAFSVTVQADVLTNTVPPAIPAGPYAIGQVITVTKGTWIGGGEPYQRDYRIVRNGELVELFSNAITDPAAVTYTYTVQASDAGKVLQIRERVTAQNNNRFVADSNGELVTQDTPGPSPVTLTGTVIAPVVATPNQVITRTANGVFASATALTYALSVPGGTVPTGFSINASTGALTLPTAAQRAETTFRVTASNSSDASNFFDFTYERVAAMAAATAPTFTPTTAPGTAVGSVWNVSTGSVSNNVGTTTREVRFLRNGTAITTYSTTAASYTIVAADVGATISCEVRWTDSSSPAQVVTQTAVGTAVIPGGAADFTVGNTADLVTAINASLTNTGPILILLRPGNYANLTLTNKNKAGANGVSARRSTNVAAGGSLSARNLNNRITIRSLDRDNPARWFRTQWSLQNVNGFTFDNIRYEDDSDDGQGFAVLGKQAINCQDLANVTWRNCSWNGWCDNLAVTRSEWLTIEYCDLKGAGRDTVRLFSYQNELWVHHNDFDGFKDDGTPGVDYTRSQQDDPNRHADFLSIQISNDAARGGAFMVIEYNAFKAGNGYHQAIFCANSQIQGATAGNAQAMFNIHKTLSPTFRGNWMEMTHVNCFYISGCDGFTAISNLVFLSGPYQGGYWDTTTKGQPQIVFAALSNGTMSDNVMHRAYKFDNNAAPETAIIGRATTIIDPTGAARPVGLPTRPVVGRFSYEASAPLEITDHTIAPASGTHPTTFTSTVSATAGATITRQWKRNGVNDGGTAATRASVTQQEGGLECIATATRGAETVSRSAFARIGRLQPTLRGQTLISGITTPGGAAVAPAIHPDARAGDVVYAFYSAPMRAGGTGGTNPQTIDWATAGMTAIDVSVEPQAAVTTGGDVTDYLCGWAKRTLLASDITAGVLPALTVGFHGMATYTFLKDAASEVWTAAANVSRIAEGRNCLLWPGTATTERTVATSLMLVAVAGSNYPLNARRARMTPAPAAGTSDYLPGILSTDAGQIGGGRWHGHQVLTRLIGGGSAGQKTVAPTVALTRDESITVCALEVLGPA